MIEPLRLTVLTPTQTLLDVRGVAWIQVQLADGGGIGIWPGHAPLLAETVAAPLRYADALGEHALDLEAGILQIARDSVTIFTSGLTRQAVTAQPPDEDQEGARFDRLAQALLATLGAQMQGEEETQGWGNGPQDVNQ
jgi:F0F1-type ATP synthase epsilon subunit